MKKRKVSKNAALIEETVEIAAVVKAPKWHHS